MCDVYYLKCVTLNYWPAGTDSSEKAMSSSHKTWKSPVSNSQTVAAIRSFAVSWTRKKAEIINEIILFFEDLKAIPKFNEKNILNYSKICLTW